MSTSAAMVNKIPSNEPDDVNGVDRPNRGEAIAAPQPEHILYSSTNQYISDNSQTINQHLTMDSSHSRKSSLDSRSRSTTPISVWDYDPFYGFAAHESQSSDSLYHFEMPIGNVESHQLFDPVDPYKIIPYNDERAKTHSWAEHILDLVLRQIYIHLLLRIPTMYYMRVSRVFGDAKISREDMKKLTEKQKSETHERFSAQWEKFVHGMIKEWKTLNVVSVLLLSAVLTMLQIQGAVSNPIANTAILFSLVCSLMSIGYGCIYIIRFGTMQSLYKGAGFAKDIKEKQSSLWWNVFVLLAMPAFWLAWSMLSFCVSIIAYVWVEGSEENQNGLLSTAEKTGPRVVVTATFAIGIFYFVLVVLTLRNYRRGHVNEADKEKGASERATSPQLKHLDDRVVEIAQPQARYPARNFENVTHEEHLPSSRSSSSTSSHSHVRSERKPPRPKLKSPLTFPRIANRSHQRNLSDFLYRPSSAPAYPSYVTPQNTPTEESDKMLFFSPTRLVTSPKIAPQHSIRPNSPPIRSGMQPSWEHPIAPTLSTTSPSISPSNSFKHIHFHAVDRVMSPLRHVFIDSSLKSGGDDIFEADPEIRSDAKKVAADSTQPFIGHNRFQNIQATPLTTASVSNRLNAHWLHYPTTPKPNAHRNLIPTSMGDSSGNFDQMSPSIVNNLMTVNRTSTLDRTLREIRVGQIVLTRQQHELTRYLRSLNEHIKDISVGERADLHLNTDDVDILHGEGIATSETIPDIGKRKRRRA